VSPEDGLVHRYRIKDDPIEAVRFLGTRNCAVVFGFLGLKHTEGDGVDHTVISVPGIGSPAPIEARSGDWIYRDASGVYGVIIGDLLNRYEVVDGLAAARCGCGQPLGVCEACQGQRCWRCDPGLGRHHPPERRCSPHPVRSDAPASSDQLSDLNQRP
jgi:hypothetical protein